MGTGYRKQIHAKMDMNKLKGIESCWSHWRREAAGAGERHQLSVARVGDLNTVALRMEEGRGMAVLQLRKDGTDAFTGRS